MKTRLLRLRQLLIAPLMAGCISASAQFTISPSSATICAGSGAATFSINPTGSYPSIEALDMNSVANYQSYDYAGAGYPNAAYPARGSVSYAGIPFLVPNVGNYDSWNSSYGGTTGLMSTTINVPCPKQVDSIYTLINTYWGQPDTPLTSLTLNFTDGSTAYIPLHGDTNMRDIWNHLWINHISTSINNGFSITAQNVWTTTYGPSNYVFRRDMQRIAIPAAYSGKYLKSITMSDLGHNSYHRGFLCGVSILASGAAPVTWHQGSPSGTVVPSGPAPTYSITVSPSATTTYYAVTDGSDNCFQSATVKVESCCSDTCFWKVNGNNIINGNNILGTLTPDNVRLQTSGSDRGIYTYDGKLGWNVMTPSTLFHILCRPKDDAPSSIRFEDLQWGHGQVLVVDDQGYVFRSDKLALRTAENGDEMTELKKQIAALQEQVALLTKTVGVSNTDIYVYPNPAKDNLNIRIVSGEVAKGSAITIVDVQGRQLQKADMPAKDSKEFTLNISSLPAGVYMANVVTEGKIVVSKKFVVEK